MLCLGNLLPHQMVVATDTQPANRDRANLQVMEEAPSRSSLIRGKDHPAKRDPRLGCAGIVRRGESVLLGKRDKDPGRGLWVLPGGGVGFGETFAETLQ